MPPESRLDTSLFRLPEGREIEVVVVRLEDGRIVARTPDELELEERPGPPAPAVPGE